MVDANAYRRKLAEETARYSRGPTIGRAGTESARDAAVRATNIAMGVGNSTAMQKFAPAASPKKASSGGGGGKSVGAGAGGPGGPKTSSTGSPFKLDRNRIEGDPANVTSPSGAGGFYENPGMQTPTGAPGFYTGADPGLTQSPTSVPSVAGGPTTVPSDVQVPARGPTTQPGFWPFGGGVPANANMSAASTLHTVPPDLRSHQSIFIPQGQNQNIPPQAATGLTGSAPGIGMPVQRDAGAPGRPVINWFGL